MLNKIVRFLFKLTLSEKKIIIKDVFFTDDNENITRINTLIKKSRIEFNKNSIIYDIGAFNGETAKLFSKAFPENKIIAFEANPKVFDLAKNNCSDYKNITFYNNAISDKNEIVNFYVTTNDVSSSLNQINDKEVNETDYKTELNLKNKVSVEAKKLEDFNNDSEVLLLKIDTQGYELQVINGAKEILKKTCFVLIEMSNHNMYVNGCKYHEVDALMRENNFKLADIIVTYRKNGIFLSEYDAIYINQNKLKF